MTTTPPYCRVSKVSPTQLRSLERRFGPIGREIDMDGATDRLPPPEPADVFVFDLWTASPREVEDHYDCLAEMRSWMDEIAIDYTIHMIDFSTRLIAIRGRDEAFMFAMRFG